MSPGVDTDIKYMKFRLFDATGDIELEVICFSEDADNSLAAKGGGSANLIVSIRYGQAHQFVKGTAEYPKSVM
jgi:hypothetical protein